MSSTDLELILRALDPKEKSWSGAPSPFGVLRTVPVEMAVRKIRGLKHSIWALALHIAYWEYAVRRMLERRPKGGFPRSPSNWPATPEVATDEAWKADRHLVKQEREALLAAIRALDAKRLSEPVSARSSYSTADVLSGIIEHSAYHSGQIALLKRVSLPIDADIEAVESGREPGK